MIFLLGGRKAIFVSCRYQLAMLKTTLLLITFCILHVTSVNVIIK